MPQESDDRRRTAALTISSHNTAISLAAFLYGASLAVALASIWLSNRAGESLARVSAANVVRKMSTLHAIKGHNTLMSNTPTSFVRPPSFSLARSLCSSFPPLLFPSPSLSAVASIVLLSVCVTLHTRKVSFPSARGARRAAAGCRSTSRRRRRGSGRSRSAATSSCCGSRSR